MIARLFIFYRLIVRPLHREPLRTALTVLAVALGVAVVLAIELAGDAAAGSFRSSMETLTGNAELEVTAVGGVPDPVAGTLATLPYAIQIHPRIDDFAVLAKTKQTVPLIGLDLVGDRLENLPSTSPNSADDANATLNGNNVWMSDSLGAKAGDQLALQINDHTSQFTVRGLLKDSGDSGGLILMDIATAQRALHREGRIDRILINVPRTPSLETWEQRLRAALPA